VLLRASEAAAALAISTTLLRRLARSGELPSVRLGSLRRFHLDSLERAVIERSQKQGLKGVAHADDAQPTNGKS
jgi:excisionase family DNA binding protein